MSETQIYKARVLAEYDRRKAANDLRLVMVDPKAADLKNECLRLCEKNFDEKCKQLLESFFGEQRDLTAYRIAIKRHGADKCKPLHQFLKKRSIGTTDKNIELLAWLIDFQPRPYMEWKKDPERHKRTEPEEKYTDTPGENPNPDKDEAKIEVTPPFVIEEESTERGWGRKTTVIAALIMLALLFSGGIYIMGHEEKGGIDSSTKKADSLQRVVLKKKQTACMVWKGYYYERTPCDQAGVGAIVPLDTNKLVHQKKMDPAQITPNSIGHLWYFKTHGQLECFTDSGAYPLDTNRRLLKLTAYMYHQYLDHKTPLIDNEHIR